MFFAKLVQNDVYLFSTLANNFSSNINVYNSPKCLKNGKMVKSLLSLDLSDNIKVLVDDEIEEEDFAKLLFKNGIYTFIPAIFQNGIRVNKL